MSTASAPLRATVDDLMRAKGKAELIDGRVVELMASGFSPSRISLRIARRLDDYAEHVGRGFAFADKMGFTVEELSSGRESFSPDASYYDGPAPAEAMRFVHAPPTFAAEVRSENDYGPAAERAMAAKRADYFEAGTLVVWDVDPVDKSIRSYRREAPDAPIEFGPGQVADAEPAVPCWRVAVDAVFGRGP